MNKRLKHMMVMAVVIALVVLPGTSFLIFAEEAPQDQAEDGASQAPVASEPLFEEDLTQVTATTQVAENDKYRLYVDEKTAQVRIVDKATGEEWLGAPRVDKKIPPNNLKFIAAPVLLRYTEGVSVTQTYPGKEKETQVTMQAIDSGVRFTFDITAVKIGFAVEYTLTETGFEARIPEDSIQETGMARITTMELLPFFGAATEFDDGALLVPDGSGALIRFKEKHPMYFDNYHAFVYGGDWAYKKKVYSIVTQFGTLAPPPAEQAALPVYGIYKNGQGFLAILTSGEYDAIVHATPAGIRNINMYRSSAEFLYRNDDVIFIGNSGEIPLFQGNRIKGDRTVKFVLLSGDKANYVGMAHAYRDYLVNETGIKSSVPATVPMQIRLLGGLKREEIVGSTFIKMTTFAQAKEMINLLSAQGIDSMEITFDGWSDNGVFGKQPKHFPVESKLGGAKDLKELIAYAKQKGVSLYLKANYVRPYSESKKFRPSKDAIRGIDREVRQMPNHFISTNVSKWRELFFLMKPGRAFDKYISKEVDKFADLGIDGVHLKYMGDLLYSDQDPNWLTDRKHTADVWIETLDALRDKVGKTAVDYGFAYTLGHVDRIDNIPVDSSHYIMTDEQVPFYQIAIHGLVPYTTKPSNLRDDPRRDFLRAVEYGAIPSFELTHESTKLLARTMMDRLFSGEFEAWLDPAVEEYKSVADLLTRVKDQPIVDHEALGGEVFRTTYGNGVQVVVNYGALDAIVTGSTVPAQDFLVTEGGDGR